jgi:acetyltransferase-like isoleucine patch superfamily enzyme
MKKIIQKIKFYIEYKLLENYLKKSRIEIGLNTKFKQKPDILIHEDAQIIIGNNVLINSKKKGYHLNMFSSCKLIADKPGAHIKIGNNTRIHGTCIHAFKKIIIGNNCLIAANCQIFDCNAHDISFPEVSNRINTFGLSKEIEIEDNVWLATGVIVLPGVKIGNGSIITANSVVHMDIPPMVIAGGNPIKIIRKYN